jgi:hypothetical protein
MDLSLESCFFLNQIINSGRLPALDSKIQQKALKEFIAALTKWGSALVPEDYNSISKTHYKFNSSGRPMMELSVP